MANEPSQYPNPVAPGGMGSPDPSSYGGGGMAGWDSNSLREDLSQDSPRTNIIRNSAAQGAVIGTPGTLPSAGWAVFAAAGLATNVVNLGTINGMDFIDLQIVGTTSSTFYVFSFDSVGGVASPGQAWSESFFAAIVGGSLANITATNIDPRWTGASDVSAAPIQLTPFLTRYSQTGIAPAGTTAAVPAFSMAFLNGVAINITIRFAWPQHELGDFSTSPIRTTAAAVTRFNGAVRQPFLGSAPLVASITGFGTGAGAGIINRGSDADRSQGEVIIYCGPNPGSSGTVVLTFPAGVAANQYFIYGDWITGPPTLGVAGSQLTVTWTASRTILPNEVLRMAYQWATST